MQLQAVVGRREGQAQIGDPIGPHAPLPLELALARLVVDVGRVVPSGGAEAKLAARLKRDFPRRLNDAPALLPAENTALRRALETWFRANHVKPNVVAEFEDLALMKVMAADAGAERSRIPL